MDSDIAIPINKESQFTELVEVKERSNTVHFDKLNVLSVKD